MDLLHTQRAARWILAAAVALGVGTLWLRNAPQRVSTDVLDLVPRSESAPELAMIRTLAGDRQARVVLICLAPQGAAGLKELREPGLAAARDAAVASLKRSGAFEDVVVVSSGSYRETLGRLVFERRFDLLGPAFLEARWKEHAREAPQAPWSAWLAERTAARLEAYLYRPEAVGFQDLLHADPLLLLPAMAERLQGFADSPGETASPRVLIWALARGSPLEKEGQESVFAAMEGAEREVLAAAPATALRWSGVVRLAAQSRRHIESEFSQLNLLSFAAVLAVVLSCVRRPARALLLAPIVLFSMLGAWSAVMLAFDRVHVVVFVVGSLLCGVSIDYGLFIFLQAPSSPGEPYRAKVGRLLRPLLASSLTIVLGFSTLLASDLPLVRQVGVFVSAGLLSALASALLWFAQIEDPYLETRPFARARPQSRALRGGARLLLGVAAAVALAGPWLLSWRDDVRDLQIPAPALEANDRELRSLFGDSADRTAYFTQGATPTQARQSLERFLEWHAQQFPRSSVLSFGALLPTPEVWDSLPARLAGLGSFVPDLREALARHGFDPSAFASFALDWERWRSGRGSTSFDSFVREWAGEVKGPASLAMSCHGDLCWFLTLAGHSGGAEPAPVLHTLSSHQLEGLNQLFGRYRVSALRLSTLGLAVIGLCVFALYGWRHGAQVFAVPCGSCLFAFGLFGFLGHPLNLFHLLGAFLGVCLAHNYAIFTWEARARGEVPPPSIRISACCTAASFGVLAFSGIPVVSALGSMVTVIILAALAAVELGPLSRGHAGLAVDSAMH